MVLRPLLTEADPVTSSEGSIDPLGMYAIADSLALQLAPGVRERQSSPRFLTAIAASTAVCADFDQETVASDKISEPWQVFEWYMVEGLVRKVTDGAQLVGLPGREKAAAAMRDGVPLCASRYLKTPNVFGFHGVYRTLSRELGIEMSGRLGEAGYDLLGTWMKEQNLRGFYGSSGGPGLWWRKQLAVAVRDGLERGAVARKSGWSGWSFFQAHLAHREVGKKEGSIIKKALLHADKGYREPVIRFLVSTEGRNLWQKEPSEKLFHSALLSKSDAGLRNLLRAIMKYEAFARLLQDAFDDCLYRMSMTRAKTSIKEFTPLPGVIQAAEEIPEVFAELIEILAPFGETARFEGTFSDVAEKVPVVSWVESLLQHHRRVQRGKPPNGKAPWFERFDDGSYMIRPGYVRSSGGRYNTDYVHQYRTRPLWSFAKDLKLVS